MLLSLSVHSTAIQVAVCFLLCFWKLSTSLHLQRCWDGSQVQSSVNGTTPCPTTAPGTTYYFPDVDGSSGPLAVIAHGNQLKTLGDRFQEVAKFNLTRERQYKECVNNRRYTFFVSANSNSSVCRQIFVSQIAQDEDGKIVVCHNGHLHPLCQIFADGLKLNDITPQHWKDTVDLPLPRYSVGIAYSLNGFIPSLTEKLSDLFDGVTSSTIFSKTEGVLTAVFIHAIGGSAKGAVSHFNPNNSTSGLISLGGDGKRAKALFSDGFSPVRILASFLESGYFYYIYRAGDPFQVNVKSAQKVDQAFVGRVCLKDTGLAQATKGTKTFKSAMSAVMNCTTQIKGAEYTFVNITSVHTTRLSKVVSTDADGQSLWVFAAFSAKLITEEGAIKASVVCAYKPQRDIASAFSVGRTPTSFSVYDSKEYKETSLPRPPGCDSTPVTEKKLSAINFVMNKVSANTSVFMGFGDVITALALMSLRTPEITYDIMFAGLESGEVIKAAISRSDSSFRVIERRKMASEKITKLVVVNASYGTKASLLITTPHSLAQSTVHRCSNFSSCRACITQQDPMCGWSPVLSTCIALDLNTTIWYQDIAKGNYRKFCPREPIAYNLSITAVDRTNVTLIWNPVEPEPAALNYTKPHFRIYKDGALYSTVDPTVFQLSVHGLSVFTNYTFFVTPVNDIGPGVSTERIKVQTQPAPPSVPFVHVAALSNDTVRVLWFRPVTLNGRLSNYSVYRVGKNNSVAVVFTTSANLTSVEVVKDDSKLEPDTTYGYQVEACTDGGCTRSNIIHVKTFCQLPSAPTSLTVENITSTSVVVGWTPPSHAGRLLSMHLYFHPSGERVRGCCSPTASTFVVDNLLPYKNYSFVVQAATCAGGGTMSAPQSIRTLQAAPPPPRRIRAELRAGESSMSNPAVHVTWSVPSPVYGVLTDYKVCRHYPSVVCHTTPTPSWLDEDLYASFAPPACVQYNYTVTASTAGGSATSSAVVVFVPGVAPAPKAATAVAVSPTQLSLSWQEVDIAQCRVTKYSVFNSTGGRLCCSRPQSTFIVSNLAPHTNYSFKIVAHTAFASSEGNPFAVTVARTFEGLPNPPADAGKHRFRFTDRYVNISWNPPTTPNGIVRGYSMYSNGPHAVALVTKTFWLVPISSLRGGQAYAYAITATNGAGEGGALKYVLNVPERQAEPPEVVNAIGSGLTNLTVAWLPPRNPNGAITAYRVIVRDMESSTTLDGFNRSDVSSSYNISTNDSIRVLNLPGTTRIVHVGGLEPNTSYTVSVSAQNSAGFSKWQTFSPAMTLAVSLPLHNLAAVTNIIVTAVATYSAHLHWVMGTKLKIQRYVVKQLNLDDDNGTAVEVCCTRLQAKFDALNLNPNTLYQFTLLAKLHNGTVYKIGQKQVRTKKSPSVPVLYLLETPQAVRAHDLILKWHRIQPEPTDSPYPSPRFLIYQNGALIAEVIPGTSQFTVSHLLGSTNYSFSVLPVNSAGRGNMSNTVFITTKVAPPDAPVILDAVAFNTSAFHVFWETPTVTNGQLTRLEIEYAPQISLGVCTFEKGRTQTDFFDVKHSHHSLTGVDSSVPNCMRMRAWNRGGSASVWSNVFMTTEFASSIQINSGQPGAARLVGESTALTYVGVALAVLGVVVILCALSGVVLYRRRLMQAMSDPNKLLPAESPTNSSVQSRLRHIPASTRRKSIGKKPETSSDCAPQCTWTTTDDDGIYTDASNVSDNNSGNWHSDPLKFGFQEEDYATAGGKWSLYRSNHDESSRGTPNKLGLAVDDTYDNKIHRSGNTLSGIPLTERPQNANTTAFSEGGSEPAPYREVDVNVDLGTMYADCSPAMENTAANEDAALYSDTVVEEPLYMDANHIEELCALTGKAAPDLTISDLSHRSKRTSGKSLTGTLARRKDGCVDTPKGAEAHNNVPRCTVKSEQL